MTICVLSILCFAKLNCQQRQRLYKCIIKKRKKVHCGWCGIKKGWTPSCSKYKEYDALRCLYESSQSRVPARDLYLLPAHNTKSGSRCKLEMVSNETHTPEFDII